MKKFSIWMLAIVLTAVLFGCSSFTFDGDSAKSHQEVPIVQLEPDPEPVLAPKWTEEWQPKVFFGFNKTDLGFYDEKALNGIAVFLVMQPEVNILVEGHADPIGTSIYNQKLSEKRASVVKEFLVSRGVDPSRIEIYGHGEEEVPSCNQKNLQKRISCLQPARNATLRSLQ